MIRKGLHIFCSLLIAFCLLLTSCKKDSFITSTNAKLSTSVDSLKFDTVFTSVGSITQFFKINNLNDQKLLLSKVKLMGIDTSAFTINVNGIAAPEVNNIEVAANDSIYIFVTVNIDPTSANLPFIIQDSIQIQYNGNTRYVQLQAYGQNAHFLTGETINSGTVSWTNDKPYVILDSLKINAGAALRIFDGCKIYFHANAPFIVDGRLVVLGKKGNEVIFSGDRLDEGYKDLPASWPGIYFRESSSNSILTFAVIKNAYQAVVSLLPSSPNPTTTKVTLHQCIIDNAYDAGILSLASSIKADNTLISNCGTNVSLLYGGNYTFTNCTVASYGNSFIEHRNPVLAVTDYNATDDLNDLTATFTNCIFWGENGSVKDEVFVNTKGALFSAEFINCIYKRETTDPLFADFSSSVAFRNQPPLFDSINVNRRYFDFHISNPNAPSFQSGAPISILLQKDLDDNDRIAPFDIGCYEKQ
ncbi:hypothetical protein ACQ33O_05070 [Ferruginibacter sp. SUN002]|uniref:hypothetical protein n=1 Tax=Ferruginibacter sp. SUN002 TaxID=2937789 RepID=UPI003D36EF2A